MWNPELALHVIYASMLMCGWLPGTKEDKANDKQTVDCTVAYVDCMSEESNRKLEVSSRFKLCVNRLHKK